MTTVEGPHTNGYLTQNGAVPANMALAYSALSYSGSSTRSSTLYHMSSLGLEQNVESNLDITDNALSCWHSTEKILK